MNKIKNSTFKEHSLNDEKNLNHQRERTNQNLRTELKWPSECGNARAAETRSAPRRLCPHALGPSRPALGCHLHSGKAPRGLRLCGWPRSWNPLLKQGAPQLHFAPRPSNPIACLAYRESDTCSWWTDVTRMEIWALLWDSHLWCWLFLTGYQMDKTGKMY